MVKAVVGEETRLQLAEDRLAQSAIPAQVCSFSLSLSLSSEILRIRAPNFNFKCSLSQQVGLVIGKLNRKLDRGFIFDLVPTPPNDAGDPPCSIIEPFKADKKKNSKPKSSPDSSSLFVDKDWIAEHARQVYILLLLLY